MPKLSTLSQLKLSQQKVIFKQTLNYALARNENVLFTPSSLARWHFVGDYWISQRLLITSPRIVAQMEN